MGRRVGLLAYWFWGAAFFVLKAQRALERKIRSGYYKSRLPIHKSVRLGTAHLDTANISIGRGSYVKSGEILSGNSTIEIGEFCAIGRNVSIKARTHDVSNPVKSTEMGTNKRIEEDIKIGNRVWIGDNVYVREGVTIGDDVIVGANSVVTRSVPEKSVVAGVPAKIIKTLP